MKNLLSIKDLRAEFHMDSRINPVLRGINMDINEQEIVGLVGNSGSGKTITGLSVLKLAPANCKITGKILFGGRDILTLSEKDMRKIRGSEISMILQDPLASLDPLFNIRNQILEVLNTHSNLKQRDYPLEIFRLLKLVGIPFGEQILSVYPHELSGGMRQRIMIAQAIACRPRLIIADEPTSSLDVTIQAQIIDLFIKLKQDLKLSILFITHDLFLLKNISDRICVIHDGRIVEDKSTQELFAKPEHPYTKELLGAAV